MYVGLQNNNLARSESTGAGMVPNIIPQIFKSMASRVSRRSCQDRRARFRNLLLLNYLVHSWFCDPFLFLQG